MNNIPELDKAYHIFDDGKIRPSRHYIAKIIDVIPFDDCTNEQLKKCWNEHVKSHDYLYADQTDYFIKAESDYDEYDLYFVRTVDGGWFSLDYPTAWMGARLDVDGELYKLMLERYKE